MPLLVQKFGGTSVADTDRIRKVADHIALTRRLGTDVVVVVSAMGKTTDDLVRKAHEVSSTCPGRELDMLLTSGERVSMSLLAIALADIGVQAESFTGSQAGIVTDERHGSAKIVRVTPGRLQKALDAGIVPIVAGFQGVSSEGRNVTTLGRGGSDTTAVALATALGAEGCEIYTDVSGVFTADPRIVPNARKLTKVAFDEMQEIAATGGRVLALRSVEFARRFGISLHVRSSFTWEPGTWITDKEDSMEEAMVTAITHDTGEAKLTLVGVPDHPGVAAQIFREVATAALNIDMIVQNVSVEGVTDISFTLPLGEVDEAMEILEPVRAQLGVRELRADRDIARVSVVGTGMKNSPGVAAKMFETLSQENVNIEMISTSTIRISVVIDVQDAERTVQALHQAYELGES